LFATSLPMTVAEAKSPELAIIDYGMGNLRSVERALVAVGGAVRLVDAPDQVGAAKALVFPGQGAIVDAMARLRDKGWDNFIRQWILRDQPFFGICLGLQALFEQSEEGHTGGLGILGGSVRRFSFGNGSGIKVPHMGWNTVEFADADDLLVDIPMTSSHFYFVHSYYVVPEDKRLIWGRTCYGGLTFCSAIRRGNLFATQFHPEKSQQVGLRLYRNFVRSL
jgi:glutamine amidotransferase